MSEPLLEPAAVAEWLGVTVQTLANWRHTGKGPDYVSYSKSKVMYTRDAVQAWLDAKTVKVS